MSSSSTDMQYLFFLLLLLPHLVTPFSFNYTRFYPGNFTDDASSSCPEDTHKIGLQGDATLLDSNHIIQFTDGERSNGWAVYSEALPLWKWKRDNNTTAAAAGDKPRKVTTNLTTTFSFNLTRNYTGRCHPSEGVTFFLSPYPHRIPLDSTMAMLGLVSQPNKFSASGHSRFVAVEIDIYTNTLWDPLYIHVGIDVNSIKSKVVGNISALAGEGGGNLVGEVRVQYDSTTGNLTATVKRGNIVYANISYHVDLSSILPRLVAFGLSSDSGYCVEHHKVTSWSFDSTWDPVPTSDRKKKTQVVILIVAVVVGLALLLGVLCCAAWLRRRARRVTVKEVEGGEEDKDAIMMNEEFADAGGPRRLDYGDLIAATNNFNDEKKLGVGGSGAVYKGFLKDLKREVAIKRVSSRGDSQQSRKEYAAEVKVISRLRHRNLVQLVGWCHENREFLLAYEYMPNLSLDYHLFGSGGGAILTWPVRYNIAQGVASALLYLHEEGDQCVVHRDVKSSNVMLDENFNAKLGDFGLARLTEHGSGLEATMVGGTLGYMAPEYFYMGRASTESDVYAFGVVALEIATGRRPLGDRGEMRLVQWVWDLFARGSILEAADGKLDMAFDLSQMERLLVVGLWCTHPDAHHRPTLRKAIAALNFEDVKIDLTKQMPAFAYACSTPVTQQTVSSYDPSSTATASSLPSVPSSPYDGR